MALWLMRAGSRGERESQFLADNRIYLTWGRINRDFGQAKDKEQLRAMLAEEMPEAPKGKISNATGQVWRFVHEMQPGDWFVLPSKLKSAIHVGEITGPYRYEPSDSRPHQYREVKWLAKDVPRSNFDQDLLYSFGAFMTVCQIQRHNAEQRLRQMAQSNWQGVSPAALVSTDEDSGGADDELAVTDLEQNANDQLAKLIMAKFKGHGMAWLVESILRAQGYTTHRSPEGPDKGVDILAGQGPLGFGEPRLCVQVKSGNDPLDRPTLDQLVGTMQNMQAQYGLLVSWGGFKSSVDNERAAQFFRVRLWDQNDLVTQLLAHYDQLDEDIRTELPLKRIWVPSFPDSDQNG
jgi:restriction system protein